VFEKKRHKRKGSEEKILIFNKYIAALLQRFINLFWNRSDQLNGKNDERGLLMSK